MKMADSEKSEEFIDAEGPQQCLEAAQTAATSTQDEQLKTETTSTSSPPRGKEADSPLHTEGEQSILSMPCLMNELRRDSQESQQASTESEKPASRQVYESDSSNPCMLSPSSSGHLADSDTVSSGEDGAPPPAEVEEGENTEVSNNLEKAGAKQTSSTASGGRKSRRSRSESETPPNAMAAKKNRCQAHVVEAAGGQDKQTNGKLSKVKGHRSQKHKERMRLLRQKREAAARKKYNLLQDSSTSDSELTCDSSTSSSEDEDDDTSGGSKTIKTDIPGQVEAKHKDTSQHKGPINIASSDSEVEIVGVQEKARCAHPCGGVIKSVSTWKDPSAEQLNSTNPAQLWTSVSPQHNWASPPEVVDLTLDEDAGQKYLL
ncbi:protein C18orf25 homolog isoform X3 [Synchiropus splendidus]|uniref:protein C18orf25 homolog isoform X3 n=1 Tax=Synchiropus splendidus TaxID=270530 RepID=UPI00237E0D35|nr:protein C18orf25 homolog isoform X3 [Synchiropus splendidus]